MKHLLLACMALAASLHAATFDREEKPEADHVTAFRLYVPDSLKKIRSVIVLTPGLNGDGRRMADDPAWRALAERTQSALLATFMKGAAGGSYYEAEKWSGKILLNALDRMAKESGHPELAKVPLALWGHSAGGQFNFNFANWKPERVAAFVVNKGGYYGDTIRPGTRQIPALWILGTKDTELRVKAITGKYEAGRKLGALWALVPEAGVDHGTGRSKEIGMVFLEEALAARVDNKGMLHPANPQDGWLGDHKTQAVEKNSRPDKGSKDISWLPGESTARLWAEIVADPNVAPQ